MSAATAPEVRVGQIWADNDKRSAGRIVTVLAVNGRHATVRSNFGKTTSVLLNRFRPTATGYRLVKDVTP